TVKNNLLFESAQFGITTTKDLEGYYEKYMETSTNEKQKEKITEKYEALKELTLGKPSPQFTGYENYKGGTTSLSDLVGDKYLYFDIWATWCGPCIAEIPHMKEIQEKYKGKNIEFIGLSIDQEKDHDKWQTFIEKRELGGIQLLADADWKSQFIQDYLISGIPHFILLDPEGNIVDANAPRPSDEGLPKLLDELEI